MGSMSESKWTGTAGIDSGKSSIVRPNRAQQLTRRVVDLAERLYVQSVGSRLSGIDAEECDERCGDAVLAALSFHGVRLKREQLEELLQQACQVSAVEDLAAWAVAQRVE